jgi:oligopeptide transport system substrate-binding protein
MKTVSKRLLAAVLASLMLLGLLSGCGAYQGKSKSTSSSKSGSSSKVFRLSQTTEPPTLDSSLCNSMAGADILYNIMDGLMRNNNGKIEPGVATNFEVSDDGLTYTFHLRDDAKWSDGVTVKAGDFVYALQRLVNPDTAAGGAYMSEILKNAKAILAGKMKPDQLGVAAPDDKTVVITLDHAAAYFPTMLSTAAYFPLRQDIVEKYGKSFASSADKNVYNGPFVLKKWAHDSKLTLVKNDKFWNKDAVKLDEVDVFILTDQNTPIGMYESGDLDYVDVPSASFDQYKDKATAYYTGGMDYLQINLKSNKVLANKNFRKALSYGINRNAYAKLSRNNMNEPLSRSVLPIMQGTSDQWGKEYPYTPYPLDGDNTQAKTYLKKAMSELGITDVSQMTFKLNYAEADSTRKIVETIQAQWKQNLGIDIKLNPLPYAVLYDNQAKEDFEMMYTGWVPDYDDPNAFLELFSTGGAYNYSQYSNAEFDKYMTAAQQTTDTKTRFDALFAAEKVVTDDLPLINLDATKAYYLHSSKLKNYSPYYVGTNKNFIGVEMK